MDLFPDGNKTKIKYPIEKMNLKLIKLQDSMLEYVFSRLVRHQKLKEFQQVWKIGLIAGTNFPPPCDVITGVKIASNNFT